MHPTLERQLPSAHPNGQLRVAHSRSYPLLVRNGMNRQTNVNPAISRLRIKNRKGFPSRHSFTRSTRILAYLSDLQEVVKTFLSTIAHVVTTVQGSEHRSAS